MNLIHCKDPLSLDLEELYELNWPFDLYFRNLISKQTQDVNLWVDSLKKPKVSILYLRGSFYVIGDSEHFDCGDSLARLTRNLNENSSINQHIRIASLPKKLVPEKIEGFRLVKEICCGLFFLNPRNFMQVEKNSKIQPLVLEDACEIANNTAYEIDKDYVFCCINGAPSVAIKENGELLCYMLVHLNGSIGMLFTAEEYRRKGFASSVISQLTKIQTEKGNPVFCYIVRENVHSRRVFEKLGFEHVAFVSWLRYEIE